MRARRTSTGLEGSCLVRHNAELIPLRTAAASVGACHAAKAVASHAVGDLHLANGPRTLCSSALLGVDALDCRAFGGLAQTIVVTASCGNAVEGERI